MNFEIFDSGTVVVLTPLTDAAREWVRDNVSIEPWQWLGHGFACEPCLAQDILAASEEEA